jgi:hypothetical protein
MAMSSAWMIGATLGGVTVLGVLAKYLLANNGNDNGNEAGHRRRRAKHDRSSDMHFLMHSDGAGSSRPNINDEARHDTGRGSGLDLHHSTGASCDSQCDCSCDAGGGDGGGGD